MDILKKYMYIYIAKNHKFLLVDHNQLWYKSLSTVKHA